MLLRLVEELIWKNSRLKGSKTDTDSHINFLEVRAVQLALSTFQERIIGHTVVVMCHVGQISSSDLSQQTEAPYHSLDDLARQIIKWTEIQDLRMLASYMPGKRK